MHHAEIRNVWKESQLKNLLFLRKKTKIYFNPARVHFTKAINKVLLVSVVQIPVFDIVEDGCALHNAVPDGRWSGLTEDQYDGHCHVEQTEVPKCLKSNHDQENYATDDSRLSPVFYLTFKEICLITIISYVEQIWKNDCWIFLACLFIKNIVCLHLHQPLYHCFI